MSLFLPTIPQSSDNLDFSQGQLLSNNQGLDTVFGIDHYKFSDATANKGFHNKVTTPNFVASPPALPNAPPATSGSPILYGFKQLDGAGNPTNQLPILQYSISTNNAVASPLTTLQSQAAGIPLAPGATSNVLDFTGIKRAYVTLYIVSEEVILPSGPNIIRFTQFLIYWTGTAFIGTFPGNNVSPFISGNAIQIKNFKTNSFINVFWTLEFYRIDSA